MSYDSTELVYKSQMSAHAIRTIRKQLRKTKIRRRYKAAQVFQPYEGKYTISPNRKSLKATFHNTQLVNYVRKHLPPQVELLSSEHVDLVKYSTGDYFKEHTDFVDRYPQGGEQVSVIVGLQTTTSGGTRIRLNNKMQTHNESITAGGVLIFPSRLPHSGEVVKGEKEILMFKGFRFFRRVPKQQLTASAYCETVHVLAVYEDFQSYYSTHDEDVDIDAYEPVSTTQDSTPSLLLFFYQNNKQIAFYDTRNDRCSRFSVQRCVENMQHEQAHALESEAHLYATVHSDSQPYPLLAEMVQRKQLMECFHQSTNQQTFSKTRYTHEREYCNSGYDSVKVPVGITHRHCKHFCVAIFNSTYYAFWLQRVFLYLPVSVQRIVLMFLVL